jgi:hypothetical protein
MDFDAILARLTSKGDLGAAGLGFVIGYLADLKLAPVGLPPGTAAALGATAAVSLKNGAQGLWDQIGSARQSRRAQSGQRHELENAFAEIEKLDVPDECARIANYGARSSLMIRSSLRRFLISSIGTAAFGRTLRRHFLRKQYQLDVTSVWASRSIGRGESWTGICGRRDVQSNRGRVAHPFAVFAKGCSAAERLGGETLHDIFACVRKSQSLKGFTVEIPTAAKNARMGPPTTCV